MKSTLMLMLTPLAAIPSVYADDGSPANETEKYLTQKVTSVTGTPTALKNTAAAIYVITSEDFRTQGHQTIADALRAVPGFHVARIDSNKIAVTSRGFNGRFANKLLVLIDGRSVYTPLNGGVRWELQDMVTADIDRIEVIRGPAATMWGSNAVNGVVNIITKHSKDTQGGHAKLGIGTTDQHTGEIRWGGQLGEALSYRLSAKGFKRGEYSNEGGGKNDDAWEGNHFNLRADWQLTDRDSFTFIANASKSDINSGSSGTVARFRRTLSSGFVPGVTFDSFRSTTLTTDVDWSTHSFQADWTRKLSPTAGFSVKAYYDQTESRHALLDEQRKTADIDFRHWFSWGGNNASIWGLKYSSTKDDITGSAGLTLSPLDRSMDTTSAFFQNTHAFSDQWSLMLGTNVEHNDQTGSEVQPSARLSYAYSDDTTVWASGSRAIRRPTRFEDDVEQLTQGPALQGLLTSLFGGFVGGSFGADAQDFQVITTRGTRMKTPESLVAWELGMRQSYFEKRLSVEVNAFHHDYKHLMTFADTDGDPLTVELDNTSHGDAFGVEASIRYSPTDRLDLMLNYTQFKLDLHGPMASAEDNQAENLIYGSLSYKLTQDLSVFTTLYHADRIPGLNIGSYTNVDAGLSWKVNRNVRFNLWGKNLTDPYHKEYVDSTAPRTPARVPRSLFAEVAFSF